MSDRQALQMHDRAPLLPWGESGDVLPSRGGERGARPRGPQGQAASLTSIFLDSGFAGFGIVIFRTPFDMVACTEEGSTLAGS
ncbi:MAG: hypothetical protein QOI12_1786 [Alphaproteobacteria bacterium]|nr:hypothetical protein [Alphaproteobacteria bacterium]